MKFKLELDPMDLPALSKYHVCNETECKECVDGKVQKVNTEEGVTRLELHNEVERLLGEEYIKGYNDGLKAGEESGKMFCCLCDLFLS
jgi:hypothetical protein